MTTNENYKLFVSHIINLISMKTFFINYINERIRPFLN